MSSPIMIDDGGSTRVKQLKNNTTMDHLIDLFQDTSTDPFVDATGAFACIMKSSSTTISRRITTLFPRVVNR